MGKRKGMGWERDIPDFRDLTVDSAVISDIRSRSRPLQKARKTVPSSVDLRAWCSPVEDQETIGSCTANAGVALLEYYQRRAFGRHIDASRLFVYKATRSLLGWTGDQGAYLRTTMKALALFGAPPESYWPYEVEKFDNEPSAFCYTFGQSYRAMKYYRLDPPGQNTDVTLEQAKTGLAAGLPAMFGFPVYSIIWHAENGEIPFPNPADTLEGGHAVVAVGYDDNRRIGNCTGALLIRNSWGIEWGDRGYGWLPYQYVLSGMAVDWWALIQAEFADTALFDE